MSIALVINHGISPELLGLLGHLPQGHVPAVAKHTLVGGGPAPYDVPDTGKEVLEDIRPQDGLARDDAVVGGDGLAVIRYGRAFSDPEGRDVGLQTGGSEAWNARYWPGATGPAVGAAPGSA